MSASSVAVVSELPPPSSRPSDPRLGELVRAHFGFVWRVLRRMGLSPEDADDATQRVMLVLADRLGDVMAGSERAFLFRTATHVAWKMHRSIKRRPEDAGAQYEDHADPSPDPEEILNRRRRREQLDALLDAMPAPLRVAFVLFEIEGLTQPEIAAALDIPLGTVASRIRRAREDFKRRAVRGGLVGSWKGAG